MAITTLNNLSINRSDTAVADNVWTATSATASDFQAAAGGSWTFIKSQTASGEASVDFVDGTAGTVFDSTYIAYELWGFKCQSDDDDRRVDCLISDDGGSTWKTSGYKQTGVKVRSASVSATQRTTDYFSNDSTGTATGEDLNFRATFFNPTTTGYPMMIYQNIYMNYQGYETFETGGGIYTTAGAIDGIRMISNVGNFSCDSLKLYGLSGS